MKAYNYSIAEDYKQKLVIPYIGVELDGWMTFFAGIIGFITMTVVIGAPLSLVVGNSNGYLISAGLSIGVVFVIISYMNEINTETGKTKLQEFYYLSIKKYRYIYDARGNKHYITPRKKGVIYINARR